MCFFSSSATPTPANEEQRKLWNSLPGMSPDHSGNTSGNASPSPSGDPTGPGAPGEGGTGNY